jgi:hypothetical protein
LGRNGSSTQRSSRSAHSGPSTAIALERQVRNAVALCPAADRCAAGRTLADVPPCVALLSVCVCARARVVGARPCVTPTGVGAAPAFVYRKHMPPDKNKSNSHTDGAVPFPPAEQFASTYSKKMLLDGTAGQPGYERTAAFKVKEVQIQLGDKKLHVTVPSSHTMHPEPDMRAANVRNLREDGIRSAGLPRTRLPYYNIVPGVGGDDPAQGRCVFDAYQDHTSKYRDSRRFAQMNNPRIPRHFSLNPLTGEVAPFKQAPPAELFPVNPVRPPLASLAQVRPPEVNAHKTVFETRPW